MVTILVTLLWCAGKDAMANANIWDHSRSFALFLNFLDEPRGDGVPVSVQQRLKALDRHPRVELA